MKAIELRKKNDTQLNEQLLLLYKERFNLQLQKSINQLENPKRLKTIRRIIARIKTIMYERLRSATNEQV